MSNRDIRRSEVPLVQWTVWLVTLNPILAPGERLFGKVWIQCYFIAFCSWYYVGIISILLLVLYFHARGIFEVSETKLRNHHKVNVSIAPRERTRHPLLDVRLKWYRWVAGKIRNCWFFILTNYQVLLLWWRFGGSWIKPNGSKHDTSNCILK